jgi:hypothetical protein
MKEIGSGRFEAFSAGVTPKGQVSPMTLKVFTRQFWDRRIWSKK